MWMTLWALQTRATLTDRTARTSRLSAILASLGNSWRPVTFQSPNEDDIFFCFQISMSTMVMDPTRYSRTISSDHLVGQLERSLLRLDDVTPYGPWRRRRASSSARAAAKVGGSLGIELGDHGLGLGLPAHRAPVGLRRRERVEERRNDVRRVLEADLPRSQRATHNGVLGGLERLGREVALGPVGVDPFLRVADQGRDERVRPRRASATGLDVMDHLVERPQQLVQRPQRAPLGDQDVGLELCHE
mmetsp:Transcript_7106/g.21688  ORF Transcript_7106/g.21688 Transcript_7106/m.21688 type:complete len:246 (+) Transcript_7106:270-1007(+)